MISVKDLISMGYRKISNNIFAKPFGFSLYIFKLKELEIGQYFKAATGEFLCWSKKECDSLVSLKEYECYSRPSMNTGWYSEFEFLTKEEQAKDWLDKNFL